MAMMTIEQYMALPYTMVVRWNEDDAIYMARVQEIEGCTGHGSTPGNALDMLRDNFREWIGFSLEHGDEIPVPAESLPSGKWVQRVPRSLHKRVVECAEAEGVSLNSYVATCLARAAGRAESHTQKPGQISVLHATLAAFDNRHERYCLYGAVSVDPWRAITHEPVRSMQVYLTGSDMTRNLSSFTDTVAEQVGIHSVTPIGRIQRDSKEKKEAAYA